LKQFFLYIIDSVVTFCVATFLSGVAKKSEEEGIQRCLNLLNFFLKLIPRYHKTALKNLSIAFPEKSPEERAALAKKSYRVLAANLYWFAKLRLITADEIEALFDYSEAQVEVDKVIAHGKGGLYLTPHFGLFELLAQAHCVKGRKSKVLIREFGLPKLDKYWTETRQRFGLEVFGRKGGFQEMIVQLHRGQDVAVLFDQNVRRSHAMFVNLFGVPAATTKAVGLAAIRADSHVVLAACIENTPERRQFGRYRIYVRSVLNPNMDPELTGLSTEEKVRSFLERVHRELETLIRFQPESWFWIHRRWKTRPEGEPENFYD